jgi:ABC-type transport system involved in cytochrome bd biosynthesis fused ATPase/permease subunit
MEKFEQQVAGIVNAEQSRMLSGGELQKVNIARLMYSHHRVLILDEPDSFTDSSTKSTLMKWIAATKHDKIILVITHDKELLDICDTVYVLEQIGIKHSIIKI